MAMWKGTTNHNNNTERESGQPQPNWRKASFPKPLLVLGVQSLDEYPCKQSHTENLPPVPVSKAHLRKTIFTKRATSGVVSPDVLRLVEIVRQAVYPHYSVEFYAEQSKLYLYLCNETEAFGRIEVDLTNRLSYEGVLWIACKLKKALARKKPKRVLIFIGRITKTKLSGD